MRLEVFLAPHCITCNEALRLVERVRLEFPTVDVGVHDLEVDPAARPPGGLRGTDLPARWPGAPPRIAAARGNGQERG
jgi:hypothetical protein